MIYLDATFSLTHSIINQISAMVQLDITPKKFQPHEQIPQNSKLLYLTDTKALNRDLKNLATATRQNTSTVLVEMIQHSGGHIPNQGKLIEPQKDMEIESCYIEAGALCFGENSPFIPDSTLTKFDMYYPCASHEQNVNWMDRRKALFLDRDGVVIVDKKYLKEISEIEINQKLLPLMQWASAQKIDIHILTNQSGVARGQFSEADVLKINQEIEKRLLNFNIQLTSWQTCPYHQEKGKPPYNKFSLLRKPNPGMLLNAIKNTNIDPSISIMIGDKSSDALHIPNLKCAIYSGDYQLDDTTDAFHEWNDLVTYAQNFLSK